MFKLLAILIVFPSVILAQDTLKVYRLGEVSVGGSKLSALSQSQTHRVSYHTLQSTDAISASQLRFVTPGARARTNSRGETNFMIRGAAERHLGVFFDGMPLNLAYDNRADLSFLPMDVIGGVQVNPLGASSLYGANIMGGAVVISTPERYINGSDYNFRTQVDNAGGYLTSAMYNSRSDNHTILFNASYNSSPGNLLPSELGEYGTNNIDRDLRDNTDRNRFNAVARYENVSHETARLGLTVLYTKEERGVQPEMHLADGLARYWRYKDRNRLSTILNLFSGDIIADNFTIKATAWFDYFTQNIDSYENASFSQINSSQLDDDNSIGGRVAAHHQTTFGSFTYSFNTNFVDHTETISDVALDYQELTSSFGFQYENKFDELTIKTGGTYNLNNVLKAGVFEEQEGTSRYNYALFFSANYAIGEHSLFAGVSRNSRFPALREAFSGALDRFIANPELQSESGILAEIGTKFNFDPASLQVTAFYNDYKDMIAQIRLSAAEDPQRRRKRINIDDAQVYGIETTFDARVADIMLKFNFTYMHTEGTSAGKKDTLENRPNLIGGLIAKYNDIFAGINLQAEIDAEGTSFQRNENIGNYFDEIPATFLLNLRLSRAFILSDSYIIEAAFRVNNIANQTRFSQLGIFDAGRNMNLILLFRM